MSKNAKSYKVKLTRAEVEAMPIAVEKWNGLTPADIADRDF
jgi:hypothetical protein